MLEQPHLHVLNGQLAARRTRRVPLHVDLRLGVRLWVRRVGIVGEVHAGSHEPRGWRLRRRPPRPELANHREHVFVAARGIDSAESVVADGCRCVSAVLEQLRDHVGAALLRRKEKGAASLVVLGGHVCPVAQEQLAKLEVARVRRVH